MDFQFISSTELLYPIGSLVLATAITLAVGQCIPTRKSDASAAAGSFTSARDEKTQASST